MSESAPRLHAVEEPQDNLNFAEIQQQEYANGTKHLYGVDENGKKTHISYDQVAEAYGYSVGQPQPAEEAAPTSDPTLEGQLRDYANWKQRVDTTAKETGAKPSKQGVTAEDVAYDMWLSENAADDHKGNSLRGLLKAEAEAESQAERRERLRELARLNMRVKTGVATGEEAAYYYTMQEKAEEAAEQPQDESAQEHADDHDHDHDHDEDQAGAEADLDEEPTEEAAGKEAPADKRSENYFDDENDANDTRSEKDKADDTQETLEARSEDLKQLAELRDEYLKLVAGRSRRALSLKYSNRKVQKARQAYESFRDNWISSEVEWLQERNVDEKVIDMAMVAAAFGEERLLAKRLHDFRLVATGNFKFNDNTREYQTEQGKDVTIELQEGNVEEVRRGRLGSAMNKFYEWYGGVNAGAKQGVAGRLKKAGVMAGAGLAVGVGVGVLAPVSVGVLAAGASGALIANRISKAYMATHFKRKGEDAGIGRHAEARRKGLLDKLGDGTNDVSMGELIDDQSKKEVWRNRKRTAAMAGTAAVAGWAGAELADALFNPDVDVAAEPDAPEATEPTGPEGNGDGNNGNNGGNGNERGGRGGEVRGFDGNVTVENGNGYTHELQDLMDQKGVHLSGEQSYDMYQYLEQRFPEGNFFQNVDSYDMDGDFGISNPGDARWNPDVLRAIDEYSKQNKLY